LLAISLAALPSGLLNLIKANGNLHDEERKPGRRQNLLTGRHIIIGYYGSRISFFGNF
jgi:hypothetical protein